jgi:hypothetical protein
MRCKDTPYFEDKKNRPRKQEPKDIAPNVVDPKAFLRERELKEFMEKRERELKAKEDLCS